MTNRGKVFIAGGSGVVGRAIVDELVASKFTPIVLSRSGNLRRGIPSIAQWDPDDPSTILETIEGAAGIINLCGSPINVRWTDENRRAIVDSRVGPTRTIGLAIAACERPPKVWINMSAVGFYGDRGDAEISEASKAGRGFLPEACQKWEAAMDESNLSSTRKVKVRTGVALTMASGVFPELLSVVRWFLGGSIGNGRQYVSWIHIQDLARLFRFALEKEEIQGPMNATAPHPVTNATFMTMLRKATHRPWAPPAPSWAVKWVAKMKGAEPELIFEGQRVVPQIALAHGFQFKYPKLPEAIEALLGHRT